MNKELYLCDVVDLPQGQLSTAFREKHKSNFTIADEMPEVAQGDNVVTVPYSTDASGGDRSMLWVIVANFVNVHLPDLTSIRAMI